MLLVWTKTTLASLVLLAGTRDSFPAEHLTTVVGTKVVKGVNAERSSFNRTPSFEDSKLVLVDDLRVSKAVLRGRLSERRAAYNLLRHHQVVVLLSVHSL